MIIFPKSLLASWTPYHPAAIDVTAIVTAYLSENPDLASANLKLQRLLDKGIESEWSQAHVTAAAAYLCDWCVLKDRYFCNVAVEQNRKDADVAFLPEIPEERPWWQVWRHTTGRTRFNRELVPFVGRSLSNRALLLIDAPICINSQASSCNDVEAAKYNTYFCDVPPFARRDDDARLPLLVSDEVRQRLIAYGSTDAEWMPFCRTLGIVRDQARGKAIQALQISVRTPNLVEPGWLTQLVDEAREMKSKKFYDSDKMFYNLYHKFDYPNIVEQERKAHPSYDDDALAAASWRIFASALSSYYGLQNLLTNGNNPYRNAEGFWMATASILSTWGDRLRLTEAQIVALLREFDATYDNGWRKSMRNLALSGLFRFTPAVIDRIRARIEGLRFIESKEAPAVCSP